MPGLNTTGLPNTLDYNLGRGTVYFATPLVLGIPTNYRDLGNAPEFNVSLESETLEHQSSRSGLKVTDKEVVISQKMSLSLTLDEINFQNLAALFSGETASHVNPLDGGEAVQTGWVPAVELGRWYDMADSNGNRIYDLQSEADVTIQNTTTAQEMVDGDDLIMDLAMGRFFTKTDSVDSHLNTDDVLDLTIIDQAATESTLDEVRALTTTAVLGALKFISQNPAASDEATEYQFHQVSLKAEGDFSLIGDEFTQMQFTAVAESNILGGGSDSPTLTVRTFTPQAVA